LNYQNQKIMKKTIFFSLLTIAGLGAAFSAFGLPAATRLDFVNIGSPASEAGHNLQGWGLVEPTTSGGNWGAIATESSCGLTNPADCDKLLRTTYAKSESDHPRVIDGRMATVTLNPNHNKWGLVKSLKIRVLDGIANRCCL